MTLAGALAVTLAGGGRARAEDAHLRLTASLTAERRDNNQNNSADDDDYSVSYNRLSFSGALLGVRVNGRVDSMGFLDRPDALYRTEPARLERLNLQRGVGGWLLEAGDIYQQLGRGQLLSLRKVDELGLDVALRGGRVGYSSSSQVAAAFAGVANVVNLDSVSQRFVEDRLDLIAGGQYGVRGALGEVGLMYVALRPEEQQYPGLPLPDATSAGGLYLDAPALTEFAALYVELDAQQRRALERLAEGYAAYASLDLQGDETSLLLEGLWLEDFEQRGSLNTALRSRFNYGLGPTLERIDQEVAELYNVRGGRARVQRDLLDGDLSLHANGLYRLNLAGRPMEMSQYHAYGGAELSYAEGRSRVAASGGHRLDEQGAAVVRRWTHAEGDWVQALGASYALHVTTQLQRIQVLSDAPFLRGSTIVGVERAGLGSLSGEWGVDTQNPAARNMFYAGILSWDISQALLVRGVVGSQRGGIKCVAGVCRDFPSFSGFRLQVIGRFDL
ncbi:MAG: hypothetical protein FJ138_00245 [Deltaproteobacteria bacterium]|nr:hypothetical protein [Deltaproteobacteria bacterium]